MLFLQKSRIPIKTHLSCCDYYNTKHVHLFKYLLYFVDIFIYIFHISAYRIIRIHSTATTVRYIGLSIKQYQNILT